MATPATFLCTDARFRGHVPPGEHPECPARLQAIEETLDARGLAFRCRPLAARPVTEAEVLAVHAEAHWHLLLDRLGPDAPAQSGWLDPDTYYGPGSLEAAQLAAGATVDLALRVLGGERDNGLALVRPPGHHATRDQAMGFCLLNNVAIAAATARARGARVAIVDIDVHHGNGTEDIFAADPDVLFISLHQYPFYPGTGAATYTGEGLGRGATLNLPLPQGCDDAAYRRCFQRVVTPALQRFAPDLLLVSAGFDAHARDPLAGMALTEAGYAEIFTRLLRVQPRLAAVLEGGYNLHALGESVAAVVEVLLGQPVALPAPVGEAPRDPSDELETTLATVRRAHGL